MPLVGAHRELPHRLAQRHHRSPHLGDLALEHVDPVRVVGADGGEDRLLHLVDVHLERLADLLVLVDHPVADGVEHRHRTVLEHLGPVLEVAARGGEVDALAVAHRDDEVPADEHVDLAGLDRVLLVDVPERLEHEEERVVVALELGTLVGVAGVLDGERVQAERARDEVELVGARVVDADPLEVARVARHPRAAQALVGVRAQRHPLAPVVEGVVDDHGLRLSPLGSLSCPPSSSSDTAARPPTRQASSPAARPASTSTTPG